VVSVFLYLLYFPSYDVISDIIMSDADCTSGREPRSVAASTIYCVNFIPVELDIFGGAVAGCRTAACEDVLTCRLS